MLNHCLSDKETIRKISFHLAQGVIRKVYGKLGNRKHLLINLLLALALYFAFVLYHFLKPNATIWRGYKIAKTFETLPSAQFAIHDVSTWAIKGFYPHQFSTCLNYLSFQYPHDINYGVPLFCVRWPNKPCGLTGLAFESSLASPW
jgi:hypothetical protein